MEAEGGDSQQLLGTIIAGKYKITELLGEGGMGCVYVGEQQMGTSVRKVAVKTLHKHLSQDQKIKERFARECGTVSELHHPNTIQVFDFGTTPEGLLYIVMEFIKGQSVASVLEKTGPMPLARVEKILTQVCGSLQEAHEHGIVHRDLKPDNIMLVADPAVAGGERAKILDFGIAKLASQTKDGEAAASQTSTGMMVGTPLYMSPEQCKGSGNITDKADVYSLGVMLYRMLTGRPPFLAEGSGAIMAMHIYEKPTAIRDLDPSIPEDLATLIHALLAKDAAERPPMSQVVQVLEQLRSLYSSAVAVGGPSIGGVSAVFIAPSTPVPSGLTGIGVSQTGDRKSTRLNSRH